MIRFCLVENIKYITIFNSTANALVRMDIPLTDRKVRCYDGQGLIEKIWAASNIGQNGHFFNKRGTKNFPTPYSIPFPSVLHQKKALHNFDKRTQHLTVGLIKGLDYGLMGHATWLLLRLE